MNAKYWPPFALTAETHNLAPDGRKRWVVAIPAKNEEERIGLLLSSLGAQTDIDFGKLAVVILLNNCTDKSSERIRSVSAELPFRVDAVSVTLPVGYANAGWARRLAMGYAADLLNGDGYLLTTDADCVADADWISQIDRAFAAGIDAVAGHVTADWDELCQLPADVLEKGALEWDYQNLAAELEAKADREAHDPWPRHNQNCGANAAITLDRYREIGGIPPLPVGEDRAMFDAIRTADGKIRHSLKAHVTASARTVGRAQGGMADALNTRGSAAYECDEILEPAAALFRRSLWRNSARRAWVNGTFAAWADRCGVSATGATAGAENTFGAAWAKLEQAEYRLARRRMKSDELPREIRRIKRLLAKVARFDDSACYAAVPQESVFANRSDDRLRE
jgi:glycosyltransferase involved in cell wall biosynthesis